MSLKLSSVHFLFSAFVSDSLSYKYKLTFLFLKNKMQVLIKGLRNDSE